MKTYIPSPHHALTSYKAVNDLHGNGGWQWPGLSLEMM